MRVVKAGTKRGSDGHFPVRGGTDDFGISVSLAPRRRYGAEESLLNRVPDSSKLSGEQVFGGSTINRIGLLLRTEIQTGRKKNTIRKLVVAAILGILVTASGAIALQRERE
jgi:hypothetical protein